MKTLSTFPGYLILIALAYCVGLGWYTVPFTGDEKVYVSTAVEMWQKNSWLSPILFGETSYYKPPFQFWTILSSWAVFGFGNFGTYFPSVVALLLTCLALGKIEARFTSPQGSESNEASPNAPLWFAGSAGALTYGTTGQMEIWVVCFYAWFWVTGLKFLDSKRWVWLDTALLVAGISGLVKSPLYSAFSVLGFWLYLALTRQTHYFFKIRFWLSHLLGILVGAAWFVVILAVDYQNFWKGYVQRETLSKTGGNGATIPHMWGDFSTFFFPFIPLIILTLFWTLIWNFRRRSDRQTQAPTLQFLLSWLLLPGLFFHGFPYRTETYLFILLPALILAFDLALPEKLSGFLRWVARANGLVIWGLVAVASFVLVRIEMVPLTFGIVFLASGTALLLAFWQGEKRKMAFSCLGLIFAIRLCAGSLGLEDIRTLTRTLQSYPSRALYFYDEGQSIWHEIGTLSAGSGKPAFRAHSVARAKQVLNEGALLVLSDTQISGVLPPLRDALDSFPVSPKVLKQVPWLRWRRGFTLPSLHDLLAFGDRESPEWLARNHRSYQILFLE